MFTHNNVFKRCTNKAIAALVHNASQRRCDGGIDFRTLACCLWSQSCIVHVATRIFSHNLSQKMWWHNEKWLILGLNKHNFHDVVWRHQNLWAASRPYKLGTHTLFIHLVPCDTTRKHTHLRLSILAFYLTRMPHYFIAITTMEILGAEQIYVICQKELLCNIIWCTWRIVLKIILWTK